MSQIETNTDNRFTYEAERTLRTNFATYAARDYKGNDGLSTQYFIASWKHDEQDLIAFYDQAVSALNAHNIHSIDDTIKITSAQIAFDDDGPFYECKFPNGIEGLKQFAKQHQKDLDDIIAATFHIGEDISMQGSSAHPIVFQVHNADYEFLNDIFLEHFAAKDADAALVRSALPALKNEQQPQV